MTHRGPDDRGTYLADGVALGVTPAQHRRRRGWPPAVRQRGRADLGGPERRALQPRRDPRASWTAAATGSGAAATPRSSRTSTRSTVRASPSSSAGCSASPSGTDASGARCSSRDRLGVKPLYYARGRRRGRLRLRAEERARAAASSPRSSTTRRSTRILTLGFVPGPLTPLAARAQAACPGQRPGDRPGRRPDRALLVRTRPRIRSATQLATSAAEQPARKPRGVRAAAADERRAARRDAQRRPRLEPDRRADGAPDDRAGEDLLGRLRRGGRDERARRRAPRRAASSAPSTTSSSCRSPTGAVDLAELVWHLDEPLADLSSLGFLALSRARRQHVTVALSGQGADELLGGYRKHRAAAIAAGWKRLPRPLRAAGLATMRLGPRALGRAARTLGASDPAARLLAMSGNLGDELPERARTRPARRTRRSERAADPPRALRRGRRRSPRRRRSTSTRSSGSSTTCSTTSTAPRWPTRSRSGCRSSTTTWSSSARRSRRGYKVRRLDDEARAEAGLARGLIPDRIIDKPKVGFFNAAVDGWFRNQTQGAISDYLLGPSPRYAEMLDRRRSKARQAACRRAATAMPTPAFGPDARDLAVVVPAARAPEALAPPAERIAVA